MADLAEQIIKGTTGLADDFRRRVMAGVILGGAVAYPWLRHSNASALAGNFTLLGSTVFAVASIAVVYITGAFVEIVGEVVLARIAGNYLWALVVPFTWFVRRNLAVRYLLRGLFWFPGAMLLAYYYVARALFGLSDFRWLSSPSVFSSSAQEYVRSLPECVKTGLQNPFGNHQELAWKFLQSSAGSGAQWLRSLENRNRDVLTVLTALVLAGTMLFRSLDGRSAVLAAQIALGVLFYAYFLALKRSTIIAVEWLAIRRELIDGAAQPNILTEPAAGDTEG